jgi:hypothetical protein
LADSLRPDGGVSDGGTGIGAFGSLDVADDVAVVGEAPLAAVVLVAALPVVVVEPAIPASGKGWGALPSALGVASAAAGSAHAARHTSKSTDRYIAGG